MSSLTSSWNFTTEVLDKVLEVNIKKNMEKLSFFHKQMLRSGKTGKLSEQKYFEKWLVGSGSVA